MNGKDKKKKKKEKKTSEQRKKKREELIKGNRRENGQRGREEGRVRKSRKEIKREREK